jgi:hypothetical protein
MLASTRSKDASSEAIDRRRRRRRRGIDAVTNAVVRGVALDDRDDCLVDVDRGHSGRAEQQRRDSEYARAATDVENGHAGFEVALQQCQRELGARVRRRPEDATRVDAHDGRRVVDRALPPRGHHEDAADADGSSPRPPAVEALIGIDAMHGHRTPSLGHSADFARSSGPTVDHRPNDHIPVRFEFQLLDAGHTRGPQRAAERVQAVVCCAHLDDEPRARRRVSRHPAH